MDSQEEYHDPDYAGTSVGAKQPPVESSEEERIEKIKRIVSREFNNELEARENEVMLIDQRLIETRRALGQLRCALVSRLYAPAPQLPLSQLEEELQQAQARPELSATLLEGQRPLHPSVRKLLGNSHLDDLLLPPAPRNKGRKDYSAMANPRNYTIPADATRSLRPTPDCEDTPPPNEKPKKIPRRLKPRITSVMTLDEATRNQMKHRYRIIIGNTSKYAPGASSLDRSTHKWLLYVRLAPPAPAEAAATLLSRVEVTLHHSYAPHHRVVVDHPPFHVSRRGWGEFPARLHIHFPLPARNRPAVLDHTIRLDTNRTGLQTLGAETIVDVWLYSTPEMMQYEYKEDPTSFPSSVEEPTVIEKEENKILDIPEVKQERDDSWLDFFANTKEMDVDEMIIKPEKEKIEAIEPEIENNGEIEDIIKAEVQNEVTTEELPNELVSNVITSNKKRIMKYIDPTTGKIYYLEMDRDLDLTKVQEIVINSKGNVNTAKISPLRTNGLKSVRKQKKGVSLLKPEVKSQLKKEEPIKVNKNFNHIENDHCYLATNNPVVEHQEEVTLKTEECAFNYLCSCVCRFSSVRVAVKFLLKHMPVITEKASDLDYVKWFPYAVDCEERYWKLDFAKRRNIEWTRSKIINKILTEHFNAEYDSVWRTKQILVYSRLHGFYPIRSSLMVDEKQDSWDADEASRTVQSMREVYPTAADVTTLTKFEETRYTYSDTHQLSDSDDDIEVVRTPSPVKPKADTVPDTSHLTVMAVASEEDRQRYMFVERKCADIGIELRNEDIGNGFSYSAVHAVLAQATRSFAEDLVRTALAHTLRSTGGERVWQGSSSSRVNLPLWSVVRAASHTLGRGALAAAPVVKHKL